MIELAQISSDAYRFEQADLVVGDLVAWRRCLELAKRIGDASELTLGEPAMNGLTIMHDNLTYQMKMIVWQVRERLEAETGEVTDQTKQEIEAATNSLTKLAETATKWKAAEASGVSPLYPVVSAISLSLLSVGVVYSLLGCLLWSATTYRATGLRLRGLQISDLQISWLAMIFAVIAMGSSYFFWGVGPANVVSGSDQHWVFTVLSFLTVFAVLSLIGCLWKQNLRDSSGKLLATSLLMTLVMFNVWAWTQPKVYETTRPTQQRLEQYFHSIDEYYEPFGV